MKRIQFTELARSFSSLFRLGLAFGVAGVFATTGFAGGAHKDTYYVSDHLASTVATADAAGEIAQIEADAFGTQTGAVAKDSRFTGKPYDADMGAYVFPFRNYRSDEARWMSADPSGFPDGVNGVAYSPVPNQELDQLGLFTVGKKPLVSNRTFRWSGMSWQVDDYVATANDGKKTFVVSKLIGDSPTGYDASTNCIGYALGGGYWIDPNIMSDSIMKAEGHKQITDSNFYYNASILIYGNYTHAALVTTVVDHSITEVTGKNGAYKGTSTTAPNAQWNYGAPASYWE